MLAFRLWLIAFRMWLADLLHYAAVRWNLFVQRLLYCEYVGLIEIVKSGESFALVRSPTYSWFWRARLWVAIVSYVERNAETLHRRIVTPDRADNLEVGYQQWAKNGRPPVKKSNLLERWALTRKR